MSNNWEKNSWKNYLISQQPKWEDKQQLELIINQISRLPALVYAGETRSLIKELSDISNGNGFLLNAGDCAEEFKNCTGPKVHDLIKIILQISIVISYIGDKKVLRLEEWLDNMQSQDLQIPNLGKIKLRSYRGDMINSLNFQKALGNLLINS